MSDRVESIKRKALAPVELARLFRELAEKLEQGTLKVGAEGIAPAGALKVKLTGKSKEGSACLALKCQWKYALEDEPAAAAKNEAKSDEEGKVPSYKSIKKRMGSTFKKIRAQLGECRLPDIELVQSFEADAELMLHYPKKGEWADIVAFREISAAFAESVKNRDLEAVARQVEALRAAEKSCHKQYK